MRKYLSEFGINMFGVCPALLQQDSLNDARFASLLPQDTPYHIYMITRRPRMGWEEDSLHIDAQALSGIFTIQRGSSIERRPFQLRNEIGRADIRVLCPYPHNEYTIVDGKGSSLGTGKVALAMAQANEAVADLMDLEVLYVGQAYGTQGSRVAPDRLKSHPTLQGIYAEAIQRSPDQEIWIVLWSFEANLIMSAAGNIKEFATTTEEDLAHLQKVVRTPVTEQQQINFTEAALIRYFRPEFNVLLKSSFPSPAHQTYSECYDLDLNSVIVELQTEPLRARLWSEAIAPQWLHFAKFQFHSPAERASMFDFGRL